jgi:hypothetical protein
MRARTAVVALVLALPLSACADRDLPTTPERDGLVPSLQVSTQEVAISGVLVQVTNEAYNEYRPRIDGDIVGFTVNTEGGQNVAYVNLATGDRRQITSGSRNQLLPDVTGRRVVYADQTRFTQVLVYDIEAEITAPVAEDGPSRYDPAIHGDRVAYRQSASGVTNISVTDLALGSTTHVTSNSVMEHSPSIYGDFVAFARYIDGNNLVIFHDLRDGTEMALLPAAIDQRRPHVHGDRVVFDAFVGGRPVRDLAIYEISTGSIHHIVADGNQSFARISGDFVVYDDDSAGGRDVVLMHIPTGFTHRITGPSTYDYFGDIDGNRVVFTSDAAGKHDIWMYEFTATFPSDDPGNGDPVVVTPMVSCAEAAPPALGMPLFATTVTRRTGQPRVETHLFAGLDYSVVLIDNNRCAGVWATLNGESLLDVQESNPRVTCLWAVKEVRAENYLQVSVRGEPGCAIDLAFYGLAP